MPTFEKSKMEIKITEITDEGKLYYRAALHGTPSGMGGAAFSESLPEALNKLAKLIDDEKMMVPRA